MATADSRQSGSHNPGRTDNPDAFNVSELAAENPGAQSPFGEDVEFPLPLDQIRYAHPTLADMPNLAGA